MKWLIPLLLLSTGVLADTATTGNLLPNAGTGQTSPQHSNSTIDGINSSNGFTLNNVTDYSSNFNELEANGTGTVSASGTLLDISAGDHTTTEDSLDGGVTLTSKTEVQNCEWVGSAHQCGQATSGQDSYSTTVTILDENDEELATVTQNRNTDAGYNNNTHTYIDTVTHTGEGSRKWSWQWEGIDGNNPNSTGAVGPNLLGAELKATLLDILYSPLPPEIKNEIVEIFDDLGNEFEEIEQIVEEFFFEEEFKMEEEFEMEPPVMTVIEKEEEFEMEPPVMMVMEKEEEFEEEPVFEETIIVKEEKEEKKPVMKMTSMIKEEEKEENEVMQMIETFTEEEKEEEKTTSELLQEGFEEEQKENEQEESNSEATKTTDATEESDSKQEEVQQKETKTAGLETILEKIDEKVKQIDKNLELKNLVKIKVMSSGDLLEAYNIPFYEPRIIYEDQIDIKDNRIIYDIDLVEYKQKDPIFIQKQKLNSILQERQNLINELEVLQNG